MDSIIFIITGYSDDIFKQIDEIVGVHTGGGPLKNYGTALNDRKLVWMNLLIQQNEREEKIIDETLWRRSAELLEERLQEVNRNKNTALRNVDKLKSRLERKKVYVSFLQQEIQAMIDDYKQVKQENKQLKTELLSSDADQ